MMNILVLAHDDDGQESRLQVALDLGRALGGHITCLDVIYAPPVIGAGMYEDSYAIAALVTEEKSREQANKVRIEHRLTSEDVPWDWIDTAGDVAHCIRRAATLADVIVVNRKLVPSAIDMLRTVSELVVKSGKPVVAVPADCKRLDLSTALVAWDGGPCAAAALRAAVPLLRVAEKVVILEIDDGSIAPPAEDAATYLSRHGVTSTIERIDVGPQGAGKQILGLAESGAFGYLVMGGFGHLRFTEALFGGVTRTMLDRSPIPLFMAH
ncbi:MAG TPA: universal stress protein [Sphingomonas sp.]|nr:universal stress protein [Sphingomonas sp.]